MAFRNSVLEALTTEVLTQWGMRSHAHAHEITTKSWQHSTLGSTLTPPLSSAGNFVSAQFEDFVDKTPPGLLQVHAHERQNNQHHLDRTECTWELLEYPEGCPGQAQQTPAHSKLRKCACVSAWETWQVCDKPTECCSQTLWDWVLTSAEQSAVENLECLILHPCFILLAYAFQNSVKSTAVWGILRLNMFFSVYKLWSCKWLILIMGKICHV